MAQTSLSNSNSAIPPQVPARACGCPCPHHGDTTVDDEGRNPKRRRPDSYLQACSTTSFTVTPYAATPVDFQSTGCRAFEPYTNSDTNILGPALYTSPHLHPSSIQNHLGFNGAYSLQQGLAGSHDISLTTYTATSNTLSPRSFERPLSADPQNSATLSQGDGTELRFVGLDFEVGNFEWLYNESEGHVCGLGGAALLTSPLPDEAFQNAGDGIRTGLTPVAAQQDNGDAISLVSTETVRRTTPSDEPWSSVRLSYLGGGRNHSNGELSQDVWASTRTPQSLQPHNRGLKPLQPSTKGFTDPRDLRWNNTVLREGVLHQVRGKTLGRKIGKPPARRHGPLKRESAIQAMIIRDIRSCYQCRIMNIKCSTGDPCKPCSIKPVSPFNTRICFRQRLPDYTKVFSPVLVVARYNSVDDLLKNNTNGFTENKIEIEMSSGPQYPCIRLTVHEFQPTKEEFLELLYIGSSTGDSGHKFTPSYAPPIGLHETDFQDVEAKCSSHIDSIIEQERDVGEATKGDISMLSWEIFKAVNDYRQSYAPNEQSLLKKAVKLHAMHYFMSRLIIFTETSAKYAVSCLRTPQMWDYKPTKTSNVLNLQLKRVMNNMISKLMRDVLEELDQRLLTYKRDKARWAETFSVILVLCICIEAVQVANDSSAIAALRKNPSSPVSRSGICRDLDNRIFRHLTDFFHTVYKSHRPKIDKKGKLGFNPILYGLEVSEIDGITPQMVGLVKNIQKIEQDRRGDIAKRAKAPSFDSKPDLLTHHMAFRKRNSGRLVARFLKSFHEWPTEGE